MLCYFPTFKIYLFGLFWVLQMFHIFYSAKTERMGHVEWKFGNIRVYFSIVKSVKCQTFRKKRNLKWREYFQVIFVGNTFFHFWLSRTRVNCPIHLVLWSIWNEFVTLKEHEKKGYYDAHSIDFSRRNSLVPHFVFIFRFQFYPFQSRIFRNLGKYSRNGMR